MSAGCRDRGSERGPSAAWLWGALGYLLGCAGLRSDPYAPSADWNAHVYGRGGPQGEALAGTVLRTEVCEGEDLRPDYGRLDEAALVHFLERHDTPTSVERPRPDLAYVTLRDAAGKKLRLRVAVLASADDAGRELATAIAQQGAGAWGIHRSNLAVLGPVDAPERMLDLVSTTKLACWGVLTVGSSAEVLVIPGGYREL